MNALESFLEKRCVWRMPEVDPVEGRTYGKVTRSASVYFVEDDREEFVGHHYELSNGDIFRTWEERFKIGDNVVLLNFGRSGFASKAAFPLFFHFLVNVFINLMAIVVLLVFLCGAFVAVVNLFEEEKPNTLPPLRSEALNETIKELEREYDIILQEQKKQ